MVKLPSPLSVEAARLFTDIIRNSRQKSKGWRWNSEEKSLAVKHSPTTIFFLQTQFQFQSQQIMQSILSTLYCMTDVNAYIFCAFQYTVQKMPVKIAAGLSSLTKCQSGKMYVPTRNMIALSVLKIVVARKRHVTLKSYTVSHRPWPASKVQATSGLQLKLWKE
jgi:hypothetical protein